MEVYLKRAVVKGLFDSKTQLEMELSNNVNCIHGVNGSGKTVFINLLVGTLNCQLEYLKKIKFSSITIYTLKEGNKRPSKMFTASRTDNEITYNFHVGLTPKCERGTLSRVAFLRTVPEIDLPIKKGDSITISLDDEGFNISSYRVKILIESILAATYVPLLRGHESVVAKRRLRNIEGGNDPYVQMLSDLQEEFVGRYGSANSKVGVELEKLKSKMFEHLLFTDSDASIKQDMEVLRTLTDSGSVSDYTEEQKEQVINDIEDANITISTKKVERHFSIWRETQEDVLETSRALQQAQSGGKEIDSTKLIRLNEEYSKAYFRCLASIKFDRKFSHAIEDIKKAQKKKDMALSPFRSFESQMNTFLTKNKKFRLGTSGNFEIRFNGKVVQFHELSSGEKHILAILARVCLSAVSKSTLFIADEPELSLHLEWQRKIIPAINEISPEMQIIVATHSPAVIPENALMINILECYSYDE